MFITVQPDNTYVIHYSVGPNDSVIKKNPMFNLRTICKLYLKFQCAGIISYITYQHANEFKMSVPYQFPDLRT